MINADGITLVAAFHKLVHEDGEKETARGVGAAGTIIGLSSYSNTLWEDVVAVGREGTQEGMDFVAQLYVFSFARVHEDICISPCFRNAAHIEYRLHG